MLENDTQRPATPSKYQPHSHQCMNISEKVVRRLMKQECLVAATSKRRRYGSYVGEISPAPDKLLNSDFSANAPNEKWLTDITEFRITPRARASSVG